MKNAEAKIKSALIQGYLTAYAEASNTLVLSGTIAPEFDATLRPAGLINGEQSWSLTGAAFNHEQSFLPGIYCFHNGTIWVVVKASTTYGQNGAWLGTNTASPDLCSWTPELSETGDLVVAKGPATETPPTQYENKVFNVPSAAPLWIRTTNLPAGDDPVTLGTNGENELTGIFQLDANVPLNSGEKRLQETLDIFRSFFTPGKSLAYNGVTVVVRGFKTSPARQVDSWHRRSASITYYARIQRP